MSQANVEVVRRMYDAFRAREPAGLDYFHPNVVVDASHRVDGRVGHGRDALLTILSEWMSTWDDWREEINEIRDVGKYVLVASTQRGRGKGSGVEWEGDFWMVYELEAGKIARWTIYDDHVEALKAAGLSE